MSVLSFHQKESVAPLPFPEWSDTALNSEYWEPPKGKEKPKDVSLFEDDQNILLPSSLAPFVCHWRRPSDIFKTEKIIIYEDSPEYSKLADGSQHLFHSEFVRHFVSAVGVMEYMGSNKPLVTEGVTVKYTPNTEIEPWRPWHHVYSLTRAGKGQKHRPSVNLTGKYIVRLFWMGCWRQITVDDKLPVDAENNVVLPSLPPPERKETDETEVSLPPSSSSFIPTATKDKATKKSAEKKAVKEEKSTVQIWPYILSKALLKIASLTWSERKEIVDFDVISCFTGWIVQKIDTRGLKDEDKWEICRQFSNHYTWNDGLSRSQSAVSRTRSKQSTKSKISGKSGSDEFSPFYLVAICNDMSCCEENEVADVTPCCSHLFLIDQSRDIPLIRPQAQPELEHWKKFRWLAWAIQKGLIDPPDNMGPIKCLKLISTLRKAGTHELPTQESACMKLSVEVIDEVAEEIDKLKKKGKGLPQSKDQKSVKSSGSSKSRKSRSPAALRLPDISIWCDFTNIASHIDHLHIYFKASGFDHKTTITNMEDLVANLDPRGKAKTSTPVIVHSQQLKQFQNEPLYVFVDGLDYKFVLFNLIQAGLTERLVRKPETEEPDTTQAVAEEEEEAEEKFASVLDIIKCRKQLSTMSDDQTEDTASYCAETQTKDDVFSVGHLIVEDYNWKTERTSTIRVFLNSLGAKSILTNLKDGRFCLRLWVETNQQYILNVLSDTELTIGSLDVVLNAMETESHKLTNCCFLVSSGFGQLVQSLGTPDYAASLRRFYRCLIPTTKHYKKKDLENIWSIFFEKLLTYLQQTLQESEYKKTLTALRVLFLNPKLGFTPSAIQTESGTTAGYDTRSFTTEDILILKEIERAAVTIQAFFKRIYVRILKRRQNTSDKGYMNNFDHLKKVYTSCFNVEKRLTICMMFLRDLLQRPTVTKFFPLINKDLKSVVKVETFHGSSVVAFANWIPICRYLFYCQYEFPVTVKICLFGEIEQCLIRVFDNDSGIEIPRYTYNCNTFKYFPNKKGYSVLCYGWTTATRTQSFWRLLFIVPKQSDGSLAINNAYLETHTLTMGYIPNINHQIFTCDLTLQQDTLATFRLCTSYASSKLLLQCVKDKKVLAKICGQGNIILPAIFFECDNATAEVIEERKATLLLKNKGSSTKNLLQMQTSGKKTKEGKTDRASIVSNKQDVMARLSVKESGKLLKKDTVYTVEGFVLEDSWPLTVEEWEVVMGLKKKKLVGPPTTVALHKIKEKSSSRLTVDATLDKPFWCLQTVYNKGDSVSVVKDTTREDEIKAIKKSWYLAQPGRYARSQNLRTNHMENLQLDMHTNSKMSMESFSEAERTCHSPELLLNLKHNKNLLNKYSTIILSDSALLDREVQTLEHDKEEITYREAKIREFFEYQEKFQMDMELFLHEQLERCSVLRMFIANCRAESGVMFDDIQEKRREYVESVCPPLPTGQKAKKKK